MATPFLGEIRIVAFDYAPKGWAKCNGQILPIAQNAALFSILGTQFGGDGVTTFALPDFRGRVAVGGGNGPKLGKYAIGQKGGLEQVTLTIEDIPAHNHAFGASNDLVAGNSPTGGTYASKPSGTKADNMYTTPATSTASATIFSTAGQNQPHENRVPNLTLLYIIALDGDFPSP